MTGPVTVDVIVTNPTGPSLAVAADQYVYATPSGIPTVTSVTPNSGTTAGGTALTLVGTNFTGTTGVTIGGTAATIVGTPTATTMNITTPAHVAGQFHTKVTNAAGVSNATSADQFTFADTVPHITAVAPGSGGIAGGDHVVITGTNLTGVTSVLFGTVAATSFVVDSAIQITAVSPPHAAGAVDITALIGSVSSPIVAADQFSFVSAPPLLPTITALTPNSGDQAGGTSVIIDGANLSTVTAVRFQNTDAASFALDTPTVGRITCVSPAHAPATIGVEVDNPAGTSAHSSASRFTFKNTPPPTAPAVTGVSPDHGPPAGGTTVVITGLRFLAVSAVQFDTLPAASFSIDSDAQVTAVSPAHAPATVDITLTNAGGTSGIVPEDAFTYPGPPTVTSVVPNEGTVDGGTTVTVTGTNFE